MRPFRRCLQIALLVSGSLAFLAHPTLAQTDHASHAPDASARETALLHIYTQEMHVQVDLLAKRYKVKILIDPALTATLKPDPSNSSYSLTQALDRLTTLIKGATWRRVYLPTAQTDLLATPEKLFRFVRALDQMEQSALIVENPATSRAHYFLPHSALAPGFQESLKARNFGSNPIYVVYNAQLHFAEWVRQSAETMSQMSSPEIAAQMNQALQSLMSLDPQARGQFFSNMMAASMQMWKGMTPDQRREVAAYMNSSQTP